jgi:hypothetical protein
MKNKVLTITALFILSALFLNAQENKKIQVKVLKTENGETIEIDTTLTSEHGDIYFYSNGEIHQEKIDSILKSSNIDGEYGIKFISDNLDDIDSEKIKHIWISASGDEEFVLDKNVIIEMIDGEKVIESTNEFTIIKGDSIELTKTYIYHTGDDIVYDTDEKGNKVIISKSSNSGSYAWTANDSDNVKVVTITDDIDVDINAKGSVKVYSISSDDNASISEIIIKKGNGDCKTIEIIIDEDDFEGNHKIIELEKVLEGTGEKVRIVKYKTDDGKYVVKAEILDCELSEEDQQKAKEIGLEDESVLELKEFKLYPNPTEGLFTIEFEIENKENTVLKVYNEEGKSVYSDKIKKFEGLYSKQIDISKEDKGIYFIRIIQGNKSVTKKVLKK